MHFHKLNKSFFLLSLQVLNNVFIVPLKMGKKMIIVALAMLILAAVATFVGVFFGVGRRTHPGVSWKAAVAADAGPCSEVGR